MASTSIVARNSTVSGNEDSSFIALFFNGTVTDPGSAITGFRITALPTNGTLYLDQALTVPATLGSFLPNGVGTLPLYFTPAQDFNGAVDLKYVAVAGSAGGAANPVDYYLTVSGLDGGGVVSGHEGAFAVADFRFDIEALTSWTSGGASVGRPNPAPLVIDLKPGAPLSGFIKEITQGHAFPHLRLEGVTAAANGAQTVYDLRLDGVFVTKVTDSNGVDHLELVYKAVSLTTTDQNPNGSLGTPQTISWDVPSGTTSTNPLVAAVAGTSGGIVNSDEATVTINIVPVNDAPTVAAAIGNQSSAEDTAWHFGVPSGSFTDVDNLTLALTATLADGSALPSWLVFDSATAAFSGLPPTNFNGDIGLQVTATDAGNLSASAAFTLSVTPVNDSPAAVNDGAFATTANVALNIPATTLLNNDSDIDGDSLNITSVQAAQHGTAVLNSLGDVVFTPTKNYAGEASFTYTISDGHGATASALVNLVINPKEIVGQTGQLLITGSAAPEHVTVGATNIVVNAGAGDDTITLNSGNALQFHNFKGGEGIDTLDLSRITSTVTVDLGKGHLFGSQTGIATLNSIENVKGGPGNDCLIGSSAANTIEGGSGNDVMTGGPGNDTFVFKPGFGKDGITDFKAGIGVGDLLHLSLGTAFDSYAEVMAATTQMGSDAVIHISATDSITLNGVLKANLVVNDFLLG